MTLVLENLLVDGRYWLPYRQELEVVRGSTWFDFPVEGIVRARWLVTNHAAYADSATPPPPLAVTGRPIVANPSNRITIAPAGGARQVRVARRRSWRRSPRRIRR